MYGTCLLPISLVYTHQASYMPARTMLLALRNTTPAESTKAREVYCSCSITRTNGVGLRVVPKALVLLLLLVLLPPRLYIERDRMTARILFQFHHTEVAAAAAATERRAPTLWRA